MIVQTLVVGPLQTNCYLVTDRAGGSAAIIDPGGNEKRIIAAAAGFDVRYVINTHAHFDHIAGNRKLLRAWAAQQPPPQLVAHEKELPLLAANGGASLFGFSIPASPMPDLLVADGDELAVGALKFQVLHTPGHSPGGISLYCASEGIVFVGDVLFQRGVGRYDLPGGSWPVLEKSIRQRLFTLPGGTVVYPGHGPSTTIGEEQQDNPFLT